LSRSVALYNLVMRLWSFTRLGYKLVDYPLAGFFLKPIFSPRVNQITIIPVKEAIDTGKSVILPYMLLPALIEQASARFIMKDCMCRTNEGCSSFPLELGCIFLGNGSNQINPALGKLVTVEEALRHVQKALDAQLTPLVAHTIFDATLLGIQYNKMLTVCFCCECCCTIRNGLRLGPGQFGEIVLPLPGIQVKVDETCIGCGECIDRCYVRAISMEGLSVKIAATCIGCSRCAIACPIGAIRIHITGGANLADQLLAGIRNYTEIS